MKYIFLFISFSQLIFSYHHYYVNENGKEKGFDLIDPQLAPREIRSDVLKGWSILQNTRIHAPDYANNALSCTNCHFFEGNTLGGKNGGISLVGVSEAYPIYLPGPKKVISLEERIQHCFIRSLNGKAPPSDSPEMKAMLAYLNWIGSELKGEKDFPWLGLNMLKSTHKANVESGEKIYNEYCISCHRSNGEGETGVPPIWGYGSFNKGAGLSQLQTLAAFIYWNMPYQEAPMLTEKEAIDVAAFVLSQPREDFK